MKGDNNPRALSDAQKRAAGKPIDARYSDAARADKIAANVYRFPVMSDVPDPELPLDDHGARKYFEVAEILMRSGKLTRITRDLAEQAAVLHQSQRGYLEKGRVPPAYLTKELKSILATLRVTEDASPLGASLPAQRNNRFATCGFANRASKAARLSESAAHRA